MYTKPPYVYDCTSREDGGSLWVISSIRYPYSVVEPFAVAIYHLMDMRIIKRTRITHDGTLVISLDDILNTFAASLPFGIEEPKGTPLLQRDYENIITWTDDYEF